MGRIRELLTERLSPEFEIDGKKYKYHTDAGNLFRLLLSVGKDQVEAPKGPTNLVAKMLVDSDEKTVKKLQAQFNKIKKLKKNNKKVTVAIKKAYFTQLFNLLLPLIDNPVFKPKKLVNNFSSGSDASFRFQQSQTILLGRSLLKNDIITLNPKDSLLIKGYIMGLEALVDNEDESISSDKISDDNTTMDTVVPAEPVEDQLEDIVSKIISKKTTEELNNLVSQTEQVLNNVKALQVDKTEELKNMLTTNQTSDIFKVSISDNPEASAMINKDIKFMFDETAENFGVETANFAVKFTLDVINQLKAIPGYLDYMKDKIDIRTMPSNDGFDISILMGIPGTTPQEKIFSMTRTFTVFNDDGPIEDIVVSNEMLRIPLDAQGAGLNKKIFKDSLDLYKAKGVTKVTLEANIDVGGYAWFRYGFVPANTDEIKDIGLWITNIAKVVNGSLQYDGETVADHIIKRTHNVTPGVENLAELIKSGKSEKAEKVITQLLEQCADEFVLTFDDNSKFKELGKNIAIMNFKEYNINGVPYSISYKALLSIQSIKDEYGDSVVPMNSMFGEYYLNWAGELDMNDLDDTYAYLNLK
jgi:hypothetical protein